MIERLLLIFKRSRCVSDYMSHHVAAVSSVVTRFDFDPFFRVSFLALDFLIYYVVDNT